MCSSDLASRYVNVYSYRDDIRLYSNKFYSKESGTLSPVGNSLFLTGGTYNLYSVGINNENIVAPSFNDTIYSGIKNNTDYIWGDLLNVSPSGTAQDYFLNFNHYCTQIQLAVSLTNTITVDSIYSIGITPSDTTDVTWNLMSGIMGPSTSVISTIKYLPFVKSGDNSYLAQYIMVPLDYDSTEGMTFYIKLKINSELYAREYETQVPVYDGYMQGGYSYKYNFAIDTVTAVFNNVYIEPWVDVDADDKPIIPIAG